MIDRPATEETSRALESALHYFGQCAPKHTADEEQSLFPRLRQMLKLSRQLTKLEQFEEEHCWAAPLHAEVERLGARYLSTGSLSSSEVEVFRKTVASLASMYKQHIGVEDELVSPLAARLSSDADKSAIADEMASRRRVRLVTDLLLEGHK